jgi:hypothetical protein
LVNPEAAAIGETAGLLAADTADDAPGKYAVAGARGRAADANVHSCGANWSIRKA